MVSTEQLGGRFPVVSGEALRKMGGNAMHHHFFRCARLLAAWLFLSWPGALPAAASDWFARVWQSADGLPDNSVTGVAQTDDGYLWVATQGGLVRFDGWQFKPVGMPVLSGMPMEMIRALTVCNGNDLWLALEGGVVVSATPSATKIYTSSNGLSVLRPSSIVQAADGAVWVGYWDGTACRIHGDEVKHFTEKEGLPATGLCWLAADAHKKIWFTQGGRIGVFRDGQFVTLSTLADRPVCIAARRDGGLWICAGRWLYKCDDDGKPVKLAELVPANKVMESTLLREDRTGAVWVGTTANGLFRFDGTNVLRVGTSRGEIRGLTEDREGNIWVGTSGGGLNRLRPRALELSGVEQGLPFETVRSVCEDAAGGNLWVVTQNGLVARDHGGSWSEVNDTNTDWPRGVASCVASDGRGTVWIGTTGNGLYRWVDGKYTVLHHRDGLASDRIWTLMTDSSRNLWMALDRPICVQRFRDGQFERFELPAGSRVVRAMAEDSAHTIWLGTEDGRLLSIKKGILTDETTNTLPRALPIRCLEATPDGSLWIGYGGVGVGRLKNGKFTRLGTEQGLADDFISQILADERGMLWFAGNRGIFAVPQSELEKVAAGQLEFVHPFLLGKNEGLPSLQANFGFGLGAVRTRDGRVCFSMLTGLAVVHPERIRMDPVPPAVRIEEVSLDGKTLASPGLNHLADHDTTRARLPGGGQALEISPRNRELKFEFTALSFAAPENVRLRYRLEGYDPRWIETPVRSVSYSQLPAGRYRFRVAAASDTGFWDPDGASLDFVVWPFFWQTWWFRAGFVAVFTAGMFALVRYISVRRLREKLRHLEQESAVQKDRARIAKDLHDDLGAHLSHIAMLSELAQADLRQPAQAHQHLDQIFRAARLVTRSLDEIVWAVNPKNDTLDRFVAHICQFAPELLRAANIRCRLDLPMDLPAVTLASNVRHQLYLGLKEALNNVVKHAGATEVWLRLALADDQIVLELEDNGRGFEAGTLAGHEGDGLVNLRHRMEEIGGHFEQTSGPDRGTRIRFVAPVNGKL